MLEDRWLLVPAQVPRLDVLVNNAGVGFGAPGEERQVSADGHELRFAVNTGSGPHRPEAYDRQFRAKLAEVTSRMLGEAA